MVSVLRVKVFPEHTGELLVITGADGFGFTFTIAVAVFIHPLLVPVTVYVVVDDGFALTVFPVLPFKPVEGLQ
jgi:hypothetical protein